MAGEKCPKRESHFAHKFCRILQRSCAAMDIGGDACFLLTCIAHTEDAARYTGPVRFWNEHLMNIMGFRTQKQLRKVRDKAIEAGWLVYFRANDRSVGHYFVTIPKQFQDLPDIPVGDVSCSVPCTSGDNEWDNKRDNEWTRSGTTNGPQVVQPSNPTPIPIPTPKDISSEPDEPAAEPTPEPEPEVECLKDSSGREVVFPCSGNPKQWRCPVAKVHEWSEAYPAVDVPREIIAARQWVADNPTKKKTARGMPSFLGKWMQRTQDRGGSNRGSPGGFRGGAQQKTLNTVQACWEFTNDDGRDFDGGTGASTPVRGHLGHNGSQVRD